MFMAFLSTAWVCGQSGTEAALELVTCGESMSSGPGAGVAEEML